MCEDYQSWQNLFHIGKKGVHVHPNQEVVSVGSEYDPHWGRRFSPWDRLYQHHTENSASRSQHLERRRSGGGDALDFVLGSVYNHAGQLFPDDVDVYLQSETLKQTRVKSEEDELAPLHQCSAVPAVIGGVKERRSPHSVRLNLSSHHMSRTAGGYGRKVDGSFYAS